MHTDEAYTYFSNQLKRNETLTIRSGTGDLSYYESDVFACHFNAQPQAKRDDLGFADLRYDALRAYLDVGPTISAIQKEALSEIQIRRHKLWCTLHFPLSLLEHVADLF
jgi:hypothetical protein